MRRNMGEAEVNLLRHLLDLPDPATALARYRETDTRDLPAKRAVADPDPVDTTWRERPERRLSAEDLIRSQLQGRALAKELRRINA